MTYDWKEKVSPDGRFKLVDVTQGSSDHFMHPDVDWALIEVKTGKTLTTFHGTWMSGSFSVGFSKDGKEVHETGEDGKTYRYTLPLPEWPPFLKAVMAGNIKKVKEFIKKGIDVDAKNIFHKTILMNVAESGSLDMAKLLVEHGAKVNANDKQGKTPLMYAAVNGQIDIAKFLIEQDADINQAAIIIPANNEELTILMQAADAGKAGVVKLLLENHVKIRKKGKTALSKAAYHGHLKVVEILIAHGANVNTKDFRTPLMWAAGNGHFEIVKLLIAHGADIKTKDKYGESALDHAKEEKHPKLVKFLSKLM